MNSKILDFIGLDIDPAYYIIGLLVICIGLLIFNIITKHKVTQLNRRYDRFLSGKNAETLEDAIVERFEQIEKLARISKKQQSEISQIQENIKVVYQKLGIVKYDAFSEMGGKLSFALALLDKENTGFVINAMHSREGCYTYIKEIVKGESYILLGNEEKQAVEMAINTDNYMVQKEDS